MAKATLQSHQNPAINGSMGATRGLLDFDAVEPAMGASVNQVRQEVDDASTDMEQFYQLEPDEVMRRVSGHSARLSFIRIRAMRIEDYQRHWKDVRQRELEPALDQLKHQYDIASRLHSTREFDYKVETGER